MELLFLLLLGAVLVLFVQLSSVKTRLEQLEQRLAPPAPAEPELEIELEQAPAEPAPVGAAGRGGDLRVAARRMSTRSRPGPAKRSAACSSDSWPGGC